MENSGSESVILAGDALTLVWQHLASLNEASVAQSLLCTCRSTRSECSELIHKAVVTIPATDHTEPATSLPHAEALACFPSLAALKKLILRGVNQGDGQEEFVKSLIKTAQSGKGHDWTHSVQECCLQEVLLPGHAALEPLLSAIPAVQKLALLKVHFSSKSLPFIAQLRQLEELHLVRCSIWHAEGGQETVLQPLSALADSLKQLTLHCAFYSHDGPNNSKRVMVDTSGVMQHFTKLQLLDVTVGTGKSEVPLPEAAAQAVGPSLQTLHINMKIFKIQMSESAALAFSHFTALQSLMLQGDYAGFDLPVLDALLALPSLQDVSLQVKHMTLPDSRAEAPCAWRCLCICPESPALWACLPLHSLQYISSTHQGPELKLCLAGDHGAEFFNRSKYAAWISYNLSCCPALQNVPSISLSAGCRDAHASEVLQVLQPFQELLEDLPQVKLKLELVCQELCRGHMQAVMDAFPGLTHLTLSGCLLPDAGTLFMLLGLPELQELELECASNGPDLQPASLAMWCASAHRELVLKMYLGERLVEVAKLLAVRPASLTRGRGQLAAINWRE